MKKSNALYGVVAAASLLGAAAAFAQQPMPSGEVQMNSGSAAMPSGSKSGSKKGSAAMPMDQSAGGVNATPMGSASGMVPRQYQKGDMLPTEYRDRQYTIDNYKQYGLPAPPKGQRWVGIGDQYLLVSGKQKVMSIGTATQ